MTNKKNLDLVENLRKKISKATSITFIDYQGLDANQINNLRSIIRETAADIIIAKNTLLKIALNQEKFDIKEDEDYINGPTATVFAYEDPVSPIKAISDFAKNLKLPNIKAAFVQNEFMSAEQVGVLSTLPNRETLISQVVYGFKSPLNGLVSVLGDSQRKVVCALSEISKKKEV